MQIIELCNVKHGYPTSPLSTRPSIRLFLNERARMLSTRHTLEDPGSDRWFPKSWYPQSAKSFEFFCPKTQGDLGIHFRTPLFFSVFICIKAQGDLEIPLFFGVPFTKGRLKRESPVHLPLDWTNPVNLKNGAHILYVFIHVLLCLVLWILI